jgi:hypothetical protein
MRSEKCGAHNQKTHASATNAALDSRLSVRCAALKTVSMSRFCDSCDVPLRTSPPATLATKFEQPRFAQMVPTLPKLSAGKRKTVAMLFADIKESMELIEDIDAE